VVSAVVEWVAGGGVDLVVVVALEWVGVGRNYR
jgi:hypothetical protein